VGDLLVVSSCNGMIRALDKKTGKVKWDYDIRKDGDQRQFHGDPLLTNDLVIIGTDGNTGHVYAFERSTGSVRWKYKVNEQGVASDVVTVNQAEENNAQSMALQLRCRMKARAYRQKSYPRCLW
jgi:outer membrane protein assembly factor BamB